MKTLEQRVNEANEADSNVDIYTAEEVFAFLDDLRDSGATNMFGARPYVIEEFGMDGKEAQVYLMAWMRTF